MTYYMSAVKGQGPRISLGDYEHESWLPYYGKLTLHEIKVLEINTT